MRFLIWFWALFSASAAWAEAIHLGTYVWDTDDPRLGGLSGIELSDDGSSFVAISDRGIFFSGQFNRTDGQISGIANLEIAEMRGPDGALFDGQNHDSEGIAIAPDGTIHVSFETVHGLRSFETITSNASALRTDRRFADLQPNSSFEALAMTPSGDLLTMPERSGRQTRPFPVYRQSGSIWSYAFDIPRRGAFLTAGADVGPDGKLYVLERDFIGIGFLSRVRRFDLDGSNEELILHTSARTHDNLEGIAVWEDAQGIRLTMVADDNYRMLQQTQIVEYRLTQ
ncbi:esterase-like activity of phytase family protein [Yoonia sp. BS5-3]|uniref:Esterase-like activity of phytase family protein n=1 Tax=Yoonia phaeophyticola TaxID=3137369 RepID=A0ABZ2V4B5_9RHOB